MSQSAAHPAPDASAISHHRAARNRRLRLTLVVGILTKPLALFSRLIIVPLLLRYLGVEGYGLYAAIISTTVILSLANLGLHLGLINRLLDCHAADDKELAGRYFSSLMIPFAGAVAVCVMLWTVVTIAVPWARVFHVTDPRWTAQVGWAVWITGTCTFLGFLVNVPASVYAGYQENARAYGWDAAAKIVTFAAMIGVVYTRWGLIGVAAAACASQVAVYFVNTVSLLRDKPWLMPRWSSVEWRLLRTMIGQGISLSILQGAVGLLYQCDKLLISTILTAAAVTEYALIGDLLLVAYGVYMTVLMPLWSFHGDALRRGDWAWARRGLRLSLAVGLLCVGGCTLLLLVEGDWVVRHWTHGQVTHVPRALVAAVGAMFLARAWVDSRSVLLNAAGVVVPQVAFCLTHVVLNLVVAAIAARHFGVIGVAWATPITALVTSVWGSVWMVRRLGARYAASGEAPPPATPLPVPAVAAVVGE